MKLTKKILEQLVEETINEMAIKIVKFSPQEMMQLHQTGQVDKDGVFYQYEEPVHEGKNLDEFLGPAIKLGRVAGPKVVKGIKSLPGYIGGNVAWDYISGDDEELVEPDVTDIGKKAGQAYGTDSEPPETPEPPSIATGRFRPTHPSTYYAGGSRMSRRQPRTEDKQDITQQMADIEKKKNISKKDKKKLEKLAKMMAKANESYSYREIMGINEASIHHSQMRIIYVPKKDIKKAMKVIKSMPFSLRGKVEVEKKPSDKVRNHFRIITTKQLFNAVVEYLATADIGVKTISKGKM